jgi:hypothetical protein
VTDILANHAESQLEFNRNEDGLSQLVRELNSYKYKRVTVQIKTERFEGVLVYVGQSFVNIISQASLVIIPLKNILIINVPNM